NSTLLESRWAGLNCIDYLAPVDGYSDDTIVIRVLTGDVPTRMRFAPRPDYATVPTRRTRTHDGAQELGNTQPTQLHAPGPDLVLVDNSASQTADATVVPSAQPGGAVPLPLACGSATGDAGYIAAGGERPVPERPRNFWTNWVESRGLPGHPRDEVTPSAL